MGHLVHGRGAGIHPAHVIELRAKRKPMLSLRLSRVLALRLAERAFLALLIQEPPRSAREAEATVRCCDAHHSIRLYAPARSHRRWRKCRLWVCASVAASTS